MKSYKFSIFGHHNVTSRHNTTLEFTKDQEITPRGDCIIGVKSDFDTKKIKEFIADKNKIVLRFYYGELCIEKLEFIPNKDFSNENEIVIRKTEFISNRTLGLRCNKSSYQLEPQLINLMKDPKNMITVELR